MRVLGQKKVYLSFLFFFFFSRLLFAEQVMRQRNQKLRPQLRWVLADLRDMSEEGLNGELFDCAIDKSTLDSICDCGRDEDAAKYVAEVARILKPSGVFLVFSFSPPHARLPHLYRNFDCKIDVAEDQCFVYVCRKRHT